MQKITLFIGLNDKDTRRQEIKTFEALELLSQYIAQAVGFGTLSSAAGVYTHENGATVQEKTIRAEFYTDEPEKVFEFGRFAKSILNQESVGIEISTPSIQFV